MPRSLDATTYLDARARARGERRLNARPIRRASAFRADYSCASADARGYSVASRRVSFGPVRGRMRPTANRGKMSFRRRSRVQRVRDDRCRSLYSYAVLLQLVIICAHAKFLALAYHIYNWPHLSYNKIIENFSMLVVFFFLLLCECDLCFIN